MSTQVLDQVTSTSSLSADQQARGAAFAQKELQHAKDTPAASPQTGSGTITYSIGIADNGGGFAQISWQVSDSLGTFPIQWYDWVGVFTNTNQALVNPNSNYLGGASGWTNPSTDQAGSPFTTDVALQAGMVAAYVIKNAGGDYVTVAVSPPFPG